MGIAGDISEGLTGFRSAGQWAGEMRHFPSLVAKRTFHRRTLEEFEESRTHGTGALLKQTLVRLAGAFARVWEKACMRHRMRLFPAPGCPLLRRQPACHLRPCDTMHPCARPVSDFPQTALDISMLGVGMMVGAGVFVTTG